jgi:prepilin-type N-terminal cleavage/methylation domain-containing protein
VKYKSGYTLIELMVVIAVIAFLTALTIPNFLGRDNLYELESTANKVRRLLIDARIRSLAPSKASSSVSAQLYQVRIGSWTGVAITNGQVAGRAKDVTLEQGDAVCGFKAQPGATYAVTKLELPSSVYVSSFFPTDTVPENGYTSVLFAVGQPGFTCGYEQTLGVDSTDFSPTSLWRTASGYAKYLVVELSSDKIAGKRYVAMDRITGDVIVTSANPQVYTAAFVPELSRLVASAGSGQK